MERSFMDIINSIEDNDECENIFNALNASNNRCIHDTNIAAEPCGDCDEQEAYDSGYQQQNYDAYEAAQLDRLDAIENGDEDNFDDSKWI